MVERLLSLYNRLILGHPVISLLLTLLLVGGIGWFARDFRLDASADSLVLENDADLQYYREVRQRYGSDDFLIITYTPQGQLFAPETLSDLRRLRDSLREMERVAEVVSILDVPLIDNPQVSLANLSEEVRTLESPDTDPERARSELLSSPLYHNLIISDDGRTTALRLTFERDTTYHSLLERRDELREQRRSTGLSEDEEAELERITDEFRDYSAMATDRESADIARVRRIMDNHRDKAELHLGGIPMIVSDMISFIRGDLATFGLGVLVFLVVMLVIILRRPRWVILPLLCCFATVLFMFGYLGLAEWRVTVVSSNFISLLLIITLSLTVHLVVRYQELHKARPDADQHSLVLEMVRSKTLPSLYTTLTTIVAFVSLLISGIRPVIDFGWMMAIGLAVAFLLSFIILPAGLMLLPPLSFHPRHDLTGALTAGFERLIERHGTPVLLLFVGLAGLSAVGISQLTVENRFIDYFKQSTEIYQGLELIDRKLGGTTPLDVLVDADPQWLKEQHQGTEAPLEDDPFASEEEAGLTDTSYWYNNYRLETIQQIQTALDQLPESGKVLSMATTFSLMRRLNGDEPLDNLLLSVVYKKLPPEIKETMFDPYLANDGNQLRFALRINETGKELQRNRLLRTIRHQLVDEIGLDDRQVHISGMFVLYNNVLRSLYRSQILTLGAVFLAIMAMFVVLFRSLPLALIAIVPNLIAASSVLGLMGWLGIPLDIMTITIAAITIGIAVDDTIHYVHRFIDEIGHDRDYRAAIRRCHASVGRAMYYTTITVVAGFSILVLSNFKPTIYFGLLTGLAMAVAIISNLSLLPLLLLRFRPPVGRWLFRSGSSRSAPD
jgi:hypothetical protein